MNDAVVDASFVVALLTDVGEQGAAAGELLPPHIHAPALLRYEVTQSLRKQEIAGRISSSTAREAFLSSVRTRISTWPFEPFDERIWELRRIVTAYDASYVALAEYLDVPLLTFDRRLARATGIRCEVVVPV